MSQKLIYLTSFVLVLSVALTSTAKAELIGWWKFDESSGTIAYDSSGNGNDGTLQGDPQWVNGKSGKALQFDGVDDFVEITHADILTADNEVTVMAWINADRHGGPDGEGWQGIVAKSNSPRSYSLYTEQSGALHFSTTSTATNAFVGTLSSGQVPLKEWVHVAAKVEDGEHVYYINGEPAGTGGSGIILPGAADTSPVVIGRTGEGTSRSFLGMIHDVRIYNEALTQDEIQTIMQAEVGRYAWGPKPADGAKYVNPNVELRWSPGDGAQLHIVYFGDNFDDMNTDAGGFLQETTTYTPGPLELDKVYYWRVDEFDGAVINKGDIWSFRTLPEIDPNLIGWWKFDDGSGTIAYDSSGNGNDGTFNGDPQWVTGKIGGALEFDGTSDYIEIPFSDSLRLINQGDFTLAAWFRPDEIPTEYKAVLQQGDDASGGPGRTWLFVHQSNEIRSYLGGSPTGSGVGIEGGTWYHGAVVVIEGGSTDTVQLYVNGEPAGAPRQDSMEDSEGVFYIGCQKALGHIWDGLIDDVRIYNKALTEPEILAAMQGAEAYPYALGPEPADGALHEATWVNLSWMSGELAVSHDVYFGDNFDDVDDGTGGTFQGNQTGTNFTVGVAGFPYPDGLVQSTTYYWRIDEVEADGTTIHKGDVWSFTTANFLVVDDFEDYNERIFDFWIDGWSTTTNGFTVSILSDIDPYFNPDLWGFNVPGVHGGEWSMACFYDNTTAKYSEATMTLVWPRNWTQDGVGVLSLWFNGDPDNAPEPMYVALANVNGPTAVVYHDNSFEALIDTWMEWRIDLQAFANQSVDLTNVNTISIGFGDKNPDVSGQAGGSGLVFFDDIRLYRPAPPEPEP